MTAGNLDRFWGKGETDWTLELVERAGLKPLKYPHLTVIQPQAFCVLSSELPGETELAAIRWAWRRVRAIMTDKLQMPVGRRVLLLTNDAEPAKAIQPKLGECAVSFHSRRLMEDLAGLCHELAHSFQIFGEPLIDEGLAGLVECIAMHEGPAAYEKGIARDTVLAGVHLASDHSLGLYVFARTYCSSGWAGVRALLGESVSKSSEDIRPFYSSLASTDHD